MKKNRTLVLIPSARYVDTAMQLDVGKVPPVLIRINGKLLIEILIESYSEFKNIDFVCTVSEGKELIKEQFSQSALGKTVSLLEVDSNCNLGDSLKQALKQVDLKQYSQMVINFGDTLVHSDLDRDQSVIFYDELKESFRWTTFKAEEGRIVEITDKLLSNLYSESCVFTGVFLIKAPNDFLTCLEETLPSNTLDTFYGALSAYLDEHSYEIIRVDQWHDFGHVDNYHKTKRRFLNKRFFNQVEIDEDRPVIRKTSLKTEKLCGEIRWYIELPAKLRCYIPQILDYSLNGSKVFVEMEYYGYPILSDMYLWSGCDLGIWQYVFDGLFSLIAEMKKYQLHESREEIGKALRGMYVDKTIRRLAALEDDPLFEPFFTEDVKINGETYQPIQNYFSLLPELCNDFGLFELPYLSVMHGDFCLTNILYDPRHRILKMIDPRGHFGRSIVFGDYRYDLAKLSHSFNGNYDLITNDAFSLISEHTSVSWNIRRSEQQALISRMFNTRLETEYPEVIDQIALIEALLFLSMIPLHSDFPNRQLAMLSTGIRKLNRLLDRKDKISEMNETPPSARENDGAE